uniref:RING-type domain-containing protein n=1 Tax=Arundo donax TaxID=35708 RepID=A0A0A9DLK4_ARUDO
MRCTRGRRSFHLCFFAVVCLMARLGACNVVLMANNTTLSFDDVEATFTPAVEGSGVHGVIYAAEPLDACSPLRRKAVEVSDSPFALIIRGGCQFDDKVKNAQNAGFKAAIVYDNEDSGVLVSMAGSSSGIHIYAVFMSKASGEELKRYSGQTEAELWIIPTYENSAWSIMAISFISLLAMSAILATCFSVRRRQMRQDRARIPQTREFHGMSSQLVKAMPSLIFTKVQEDNCTSSTCAICLEDYSAGEKLRVLPCRHKFHAACVDLWLTSWRTFCPVCKQDAKAGTSNVPVSESTPLFSSAIRLPAGSTALASFQSTVAASLPRSISRHPSSQSISRTYSISGSGIPRTPNPRRSYANSPPICTSGSSVDLANMSSPWSGTSHLASAHSLCGGHLSPPINIRYTSHVSRSGYGSPSRCIGSSLLSHSGCGSPSYYPGSSGQHHPYLRHCTMSGPSLFTMVPQSPQQIQLQHGGNLETSLSAAASIQSFRQLYLQHCPDSDASAQSLPGC